MEPGRVEPVDPAGGLSFDFGQAGPGAGPVVFDELGLVQPDGRFHQGVVQGVADGADRGRDAGVDERFGEGDRGVLAPGVGVEYQPGGGEPGVVTATGEQRLLEGGQDQRGGLGRWTPASPGCGGRTRR